MLPRLEESQRRVRTSWDAYQRAGGIPGVIRVEGRVSAKFTEQAKRLSSAYDEITSGARTYQLLQVTRPRGLAGAGRAGRHRSAAAATLASGPEHRSRADAAPSETGSSAPTTGASIMGTVYYRSRRGLNRFLEDHGPGGVAILTDRPSQADPRNDSRAVCSAACRSGLVLLRSRGRRRGSDRACATRIGDSTASSCRSRASWLTSTRQRVCR